MLFVRMEQPFFQAQSTAFYMKNVQLNCKNSAQKALKIATWGCKIEKISGDTPSPHPTPSAPTAPRFSRLWRSTSVPPAPRRNCQYLFFRYFRPCTLFCQSFGEIHYANVSRKLLSFLNVDSSCSRYRDMIRLSSIFQQYACELRFVGG